MDNEIFKGTSNIFNNINRGTAYVIYAGIYGCKDQDKVHEIVDRTVVQEITMLNNRTYYGIVDTRTLGVGNKFVAVTSLFDKDFKFHINQIKLNNDEIECIRDILLVTVKLDVAGDSNCFNEIEGKYWAYLYKFCKFNVNDKVYISSKSHGVGGVKVDINATKYVIGSFLDYEGRDTVDDSYCGDSCDPMNPGK